MFNWEIYDDRFCASEIKTIFSESGSIGKWLEVEIALVAALVETGIAPSESLTSIEKITLCDLDRDYIRQSTQKVGRPVVGLVEEIRRLADSPASRWVHFAATTQDILDTALVVQIREALDWVKASLSSCQSEISRLGKAGKDARMVGRTNGLHAQEITLGLKCNVWEAEFRRHQQRLQEISPRVLIIQLAGPVGTFEAAGDKGDKLRMAFARQLHLAVSDVHWQNARDSIAELVLFLGLIASSIAKIAQECSTLAGDDLSELVERNLQDTGRSSSMPHKRNFRDLEYAEGLARQAMQRAGGIYDTTLHKHERSAAPWIGEWMIVPEVFLLLSGALQSLNAALPRLEPDEKRMKNNNEQSLELMESGRVYQILLEKFDHVSAGLIMDAAIKTVQAEGGSLAEALEQDMDYQERASDKMKLQIKKKSS